MSHEVETRPSVKDRVFRSIESRVAKSKDGVDTREVSEITAGIAGADWDEVAISLSELEDEKRIYRGESPRKGPGWKIFFEDETPGPALRWSKKSHHRVLTKAQNARETAERQATPALEPPQGGDLDWSLTLGGGCGGRGKPGSEARLPLQSLEGERITRRRGESTKPDGPLGLATYFNDSMAEVGFVWGATNYPALRHWFSTGLKSGITAETFRTMVDRFAARPQQIQESGLAPWKAFLARREQLRLGSLKQATGLTQTATQPLSDDSEWTPERYEVEHGAEAERQSAYWASLDDGIEWTPERYAAEHEAEEARQKAFWDSQDDGIDWTPERYAAEHETEHTRQRSLQDSWSL